MVRKYFNDETVKDGLIACYTAMKKDVGADATLLDKVKHGKMLHGTRNDVHHFKYQLFGGTVIDVTTGGVCKHYMDEHCS